MAKKSTQELRKFGLVIACGFAAFTGLLYWQKGAGTAVFVLAGIAALFLLSGLLAPRILGPIEWAWMKLAGILGWVMTRVILTLAFVLAFVPMGLMMRLVRRDPLRLKPQPDATSYWVPMEEDGPGTRPDKPF